MTSLPDPLITEHTGILVVRDDMLPGGTKRRVIPVLFDNDHEEFVYASPVYGAAQIALAHAAGEHGKRATVFCALRKNRHPFTDAAIAAGAQVHEVPTGYLTVVTKRARDYCQETGARLLPHGMDSEEFIEALATVARRLPVQPLEFWSVAGSGVLTRALQRAWPDAQAHAVLIGHECNAGRATVHRAPEAFERAYNGWYPPFPSCATYDAKAWRFIERYASPGALFWNVSR